MLWTYTKITIQSLTVPGKSDISRHLETYQNMLKPYDLYGNQNENPQPYIFLKKVATIGPTPIVDGEAKEAKSGWVSRRGLLREGGGGSRRSVRVRRSKLRNI